VQVFYQGALEKDACAHFIRPALRYAYSTSTSQLLHYLLWPSNPLLSLITTPSRSIPQTSFKTQNNPYPQESNPTRHHPSGTPSSYSSPDLSSQ
jgi:hypothetical protein